MSPVFSICMPNYNHEAFLKTRIPDLLSILPENAEFLICDDGSTDGSVEVIRTFAEKDSRIRWEAFTKNQGPIAALNSLVLSARGDYLVFAASDDRHAPDFFEAMLEGISSFPRRAIYTSDFVVDSGRLEHFPLLKGITAPCFFSADQTLQLFQKTSFWIPTNSSIYCRKKFLSLGGFQESNGSYCDWMHGHTLALQEGVVYLPKSLAFWRKTDGNFSTRNEQEQKIMNRRALTHFFRTSSEERKKLWVRSTLFRGWVRKNPLFFLMRPKYWMLCLHVARRVFERKFKIADLFEKRLKDECNGGKKNRASLKNWRG